MIRLLSPTSMSKIVHEGLLTGLRPVEIVESVKPMNNITKMPTQNTIMIAPMFRALDELGGCETWPPLGQDDDE